jgi:hypothetical protein
LRGTLIQEIANDDGQNPPQTITGQNQHALAGSDCLARRHLLPAEFALIWEWFQARDMLPMTLQVQLYGLTVATSITASTSFATGPMRRLFQAHFGGQWFDPKKDREGGVTVAPGGGRMNITGSLKADR